MTLSTQGKYRERIKSLFPMQGKPISISCRLNPKVLFFTTRESFTEHNRRSMFWYARKKGNRDEIQSSSLNPFISSSSGVGKSLKSTPFPTQETNRNFASLVSNINQTYGTIRASDLTDLGTNYTWTSDSLFDSQSNGTPYYRTDVTYTVTGQKLVVWKKDLGYSTVLRTTRGDIAGIDYDNRAGVPRIATNANNDRDIFVSWTDFYNSVPAVLMRELYP